MSLFAYPLVLRAACMADKIVFQAKKHEVARLEHALSKHEATDKLQRETLGCISRHWCALTEELKGTLQRLEHAPRAMDTSQPAKLLESLSSLKVPRLLVPDVSVRDILDPWLGMTQWSRPRDVPFLSSCLRASLLLACWRLVYTTDICCRLARCCAGPCA